MAEKLTFEEVRNFINNETEYVLEQDYYTNDRTELKLSCKKCNIIYHRTLMSVKASNRVNKFNECRKCRDYNEFYDRIREYFKAFGEGCILIEKDYEDLNNDELEIICPICGEYFLNKYNAFKAKDSKVCNQCYNKMRSENSRFSFEKVKKIIESINGNKLLSTEYIHYDEPLDILCSCGEKYSLSLRRFNAGKNTCDICSNRGIQWNRELVKDYIIFHGSEFIEQEYINVDTKMKFKCQLCGEIYESTFYNFRKHEKYYCNPCAFKIIGEKQAFTHDYVKNCIEDKGSKILKGHYTNNTSKLKIECVSCGKSFDTNFAKIQVREKLTCKHCSCVEANDDRRFTYDYVKNYIETNSECKLLSNTYTSNRDKLKIQCSCEKHNIFETTFYKFKYANKKQCNECSSRIRWDIDMVRKFVNKNSSCELLSTEFINVDEKLKFRCECGMEFETRWDTFKGKKKKRQCNECSTNSRLEQGCMEFFNKYQVKYKHDKSLPNLINPKTNGRMRYDFILKKYNLVIKCQGIQHEKAVRFYDAMTQEEAEKNFEEQKYRDELKRKYAEEHRIDILYIWYYELDNIPEILTTKLKLN